MINARLAQAAGVCGLVGGTAWVLAIILHAQQPRGCIGDECFARPRREAPTATSWLVVLAAVALVAFVLAVLALLARSGSLGWTGITGIAACGLGAGALALAGLPQFREHLRPLPMLVAIAVGLALLAWTVLRARLVPTWAGVGMLVGVLLLAGVNEQSSRVLLALPFGLAWLTTGAYLVQGPRTTDPAP